MVVDVVQGDVLSQSADVLICPANCYLNMSGGVNGEILLRCGANIQRELHEHLARLGARAVEPGTVVRTSAGELPFQHILHAVAIDPFYGSSLKLVAAALSEAFEQARRLEAGTVALPALATGYGPLSVDEFCSALCDVSKLDWSPLYSATLVLRRLEDVCVARKRFTA